MLSKILFLTMCSNMAVGAPVLVELFTSEGCSSCPPADVLLQRLDKQQTASGQETIVLSEHVDYWNYLGWRDPFSSAEITKRQQNYARRFNRDGPYTPQMVVNGEIEFIGSDAGRAQHAIAEAAKQPGVPIRLRWSGDSKVLVEVDPLTDGQFKSADVFVVAARDAASSDVRRGENGGRKLVHVAVAGKLILAGKVTASTGLSKEVAVDSTGGRVIVFVQSPDQGKILGSALLRGASSVQFNR